MAFDKTGTLTEGAPRVVDVVVSALLVSASSIIVAVNAVMLRRVGSRLLVAPQGEAR